MGKRWRKKWKEKRRKRVKGDIEKRVRKVRKYDKEKEV